MLKSVRSRLTLWYSIALATGLVLFAAGTWLLMWHSLNSDVNERLAFQTASVEKFLNAELADPGVQLGEELQEYAEALPGGTYLQVKDERGAIIFQSRHETGSSHRVVVRPIRVKRAVWHVTVSQSLDAIDSTLNRLRLLLLMLAPIILAIGVLGGLWLSQRALKPVDDITAAARSIGIANLSERLTVPETGDELERLARTWNSMLERLEDAVKRLARFTADASHELRTPVAVIRTTAEIAARRPRTEAQYRGALAEIVTESERMTRLIEDLLFLARCDSETVDMPMASIVLAPMVERICGEMKPLAESKAIRLTCRSKENSARVAGNERAIRRLVLVLLDNAIKYSAPGGEVLVSVQESGDQLHLEIRDTGSGIPESELPHIFERFYRAPEARETVESGSGLGLSLAAGIAQRHHARIEVESAAGQGSTFRVLFEPV